MPGKFLKISPTNISIIDSMDTLNVCFYWNVKIIPNDILEYLYTHIRMGKNAKEIIMSNIKNFEYREKIIGLITILENLINYQELKIMNLLNCNNTYIKISSIYDFLIKKSVEFLIGLSIINDDTIVFNKILSNIQMSVETNKHMQQLLIKYSNNKFLDIQMNLYGCTLDSEEILNYLLENCNLSTFEYCCEKKIINCKNNLIKIILSKNYNYIRMILINNIYDNYNLNWNIIEQISFDENNLEKIKKTLNMSLSEYIIYCAVKYNDIEIMNKFNLLDIKMYLIILLCLELNHYYLFVLVIQMKRIELSELNEKNEILFDKILKSNKKDFIKYIIINNFVDLDKKINYLFELYINLYENKYIKNYDLNKFEENKEIEEIEEIKEHLSENERNELNKKILNYFESIECLVQISE